MKTNRNFTLIVSLFVLSLGTPLSQAHPDGKGHEKKVAGPQGGRIITSVEPHAEFFVTKDGKVEIRFLDDDGNVIPLAQQGVSVVAGERSAPTQLRFIRQGNALISEQPLPAGNNLPTIVRFTASPGAAPTYERFHLNLERCSDCELAEYACICDDHDH